MLLCSRHLLLLPSVLEVDVDPPIGELFGEQLGPPERLSAVGEDGGTSMLMFHGPLLAHVLVGVDDVAVGVFHITSPASLGGMPLSLGPGPGHYIPSFRERLWRRTRERGASVPDPPGVPPARS